jgi:8-oxo-dGTP diphosphatase
MAWPATAAAPAVGTDVVLFTIRDGALEVLLTRRGADGLLALPGGAIGNAEDLDRAAERVLAEQTGVRGLYLEQLYTFGAPERDPRERAISVAYYALAPHERLGVAPGAGEWLRVDALPKLALDHAAIITRARERLAAKLDYSTIAFQFMPSAFTLSELQAVYEIIRGEQLDKRNFRRFVQALGRVVATGATRRNGSHRPARLYRLKYPGRVEIIR